MTACTKMQVAEVVRSYQIQDLEVQSGGSAGGLVVDWERKRAGADPRHLA